MLPLKKKRFWRSKLDLHHVPQHIAIIMDGNGRWAQQRGLSRLMGHKEGAETVRVILKACAELGVKYLTIYTFSTENWQRPQAEVDFLMELFGQKIDAEIDELMENEVRLHFLGRLEQFSGELNNKMQGAMERTKQNKRITLNVMVNYGGRAEIVDAVNKIQETRNKIQEEDISNNLYTAGMPDPDLLIRTASEMRISNFLLWQIAYAELYVTPIFWPDFQRPQLIEAIEAYQKRVRKYGKTQEQIDAA